jgi:hypothetical protein
VGNLNLELGEQLADIGCEECGGSHKSAYGFVYKNDDAFGLYFATLHVGHSSPSVGLTLSLGKWWDDDAVDERCWVFIYIWPETDEYRMTLNDPRRSHHLKYSALGRPLDREAALLSPLKDEFFEVADYVIANDPAIASYLDTGVVDEPRWQQIQKQQTAT